jgi:hypothetical protein
MNPRVAVYSAQPMDGVLLIGAFSGKPQTTPVAQPGAKPAA